MASVIVANAFFLSNSFAYHDMTRSRLQGTPRRPIQLTKVATARFGANTIKTIFLKPNMALNHYKDHVHMVPDIDLGQMLEDGYVFRQNFHIRSYEVGSNQTVAIETLTNIFQEAIINHVKAVGEWDHGLGLTREMCKKNLIWVMAKLQLVVDRYPIWSDVIQVDIRNGAYGKIGMVSNGTFCDAKTGDILIKASCLWLMMNEETRKLSKFPDEVHNELDKHFTDTTPPMSRKWSTRDKSNVDYVRKGLTPIWSDLDINQHVNNAKYIGWILESVPYTIVENYELASLNLEYCRECRKEDMLRSHTYVIGTGKDNLGDRDRIDCEHSLQLEIGGGMIMKGWTTWRQKKWK
ncbi:hypothetical protein QVD17_26096 [Tagetes erecta]|uniref:Acyl-[acyl-carrier-protein] hydrolase n=1 Tax=Tagetes erecta TaxID=13708 RepID=A0AAD8K8Q3_TARER|nr:hypothetical protein QVD17_26096 [Tagetes erecta]